MWVVDGYCDLIREKIILFCRSTLFIGQTLEGDLLHLLWQCCWVKLIQYFTIFLPCLTHQAGLPPHWGSLRQELHPDMMDSLHLDRMLKQKVDVMNEFVIDIFKLFDSMIGYDIFYNCDLLNLLFSLQQMNFWASWNSYSSNSCITLFIIFIFKHLSKSYTYTQYSTVWRRLRQFTWRPSYNAVLVCSSTLLRQMGFQYDNITDNIFMFHYLLSPCNLYMSVLMNDPNFISMGPWNDITSCDQFEIKWHHFQGNHPAHQSELVTYYSHSIFV